MCLYGAGHRLGVIGRGGPASEEVLAAVGEELAVHMRFRDLLLLTPGDSSGLRVGNAWYHARKTHEEEYIRATADNSVYHFLPGTCHHDRDTTGSGRFAKGLAADFRYFPVGETNWCGDTEEEHTRLLSRACDVFLLVGGDGRDQAMVDAVMSNGGLILPVAMSGGAAKAYHESPMCFKPMTLHENDWRLLADSDASPRKVACAVVRAVDSLLQLARTRAPGSPTSYCNYLGNE